MVSRHTNPKRESNIQNLFEQKQKQVKSENEDKNFEVPKIYLPKQPSFKVNNLKICWRRKGPKEQ